MLINKLGQLLHNEQDLDINNGTRNIRSLAYKNCTIPGKHRQEPRNHCFNPLTVLPRMKAAVAPTVAPIESAMNPTGNPKR